MKNFKTIPLILIIFTYGCQSAIKNNFNYQSPQSVINRAKQYIKNNDIIFGGKQKYNRRIPLETLAVDSVEYNFFYKNSAIVSFLFKNHCSEGSNVILGKKIHYLNFSFFRITVYPDGTCKPQNPQYHLGSSYKHSDEYDLDLIKKNLHPEIEADRIINEIYNKFTPYSEWLQKNTHKKKKR